jgi:hypothetical protein
VCDSSAKSARSFVLCKTCLKFSLYYVLNDRFQYSDLEAPVCLPYPVVRPSARFRGHLRNVQYDDLEALGCLSYPVVRPSARSRDHLRRLKMSKLLNLIAYSLACLLTCTN